MNNKQTLRNRVKQWFHPDVVKSVRGHLLGENHTPRHKFLYGSGILYFGVSMVHILGPMVDAVGFHILIDGVGYTFHAIGAIPIIKSFDKEGKL